MHLSLEKSQLKSTPSSFYEVGVNFTAIIIIIITTGIFDLQVTRDVITGVIKYLTARRNPTRPRRLTSEYSSKAHYN